jgi:hypothetical protein
MFLFMAKGISISAFSEISKFTQSIESLFFSIFNFNDSVGL